MPRRRRPNPFIAIALTLILIWFGYLGRQLVGLTDLELPIKIIGWLILALPFGAVFWLPFFHWRDDDPTPVWLRAFMTWMSYLSMGYLSFLLLTVFVRDAVWVFTRDDRLYAMHGSLMTIAAAAALLALGHLFARLTPRIKRVRVKLENLPPEFEGYRIVQLSDMHIGTINRRGFVARVVERANRLKPDLVALTGDIFEGDVSDIRPEVEPLTKLEAVDGRFFVTGNHEYYWGADQWLAELKLMRFHALENTHAVIARGGSRIVVAGINDIWAARSAPGTISDPAAAIAGAPADARVRILLSHQPKTAFKAADLGYSLQLSGHTHGGQFIPWVFFARLVHKFYAGLSRHKSLWVYVSRGTGSWGPPVRLGAPSEITMIELCRA